MEEILRSPVEIGSFSHYLRRGVLVHPRWFSIPGFLKHQSYHRKWTGWNGSSLYLPSLKLTSAPRNGWLEYKPFLLGGRPIFRCKLAVSFRVPGYLSPQGKARRSNVSKEANYASRSPKPFRDLTDQWIHPMAFFANFWCLEIGEVLYKKTGGP